MLGPRSLAFSKPPYELISNELIKRLKLVGDFELFIKDRKAACGTDRDQEGEKSKGKSVELPI
jgi:hypothetical protein